VAEEGSEDRDVEVMREGVVTAAQRYRDAMRRYLGEQAAAVARGASLDALVQCNWESFAQTARAEEELFALVDRLDAMEAEGERR
jgi:hypothetical protein